MRFSLAIVAVAFASTASASSVLFPRQAGYPDCSLPCLANPDLGTCKITDITCLCNSSAFVVSTTQCIESSCTGNDLQTAEAAARSQCEAVGVTLTSSVPPPSSTAPSGSSTSSTSPTSSSTSSSSSPSPSTNQNQSNGAASLTVNMVGGAAALGLAVLAL
ncbi:hypothetical protein BC834DRAFT_74568 [Gloeopeniophorella convolvens]|nr:hypothetical protein BC834DRAFT_74568 [Gloeopeniophorella convolvens]